MACLTEYFGFHAGAACSFLRCRAKPGECAVTPDELAAHAEGLICLTGEDDGPLRFNHHGDTEDTEKAKKTAEWLIDVFGKGNVYAELQRHFNREEEARNHAIIEIARRLKLPLLATNGACYVTRAQRQVADVFTCIRNHVRLETAGRLLSINSERFVKSPKEMVQFFADLPKAIVNTVELSSRFDFTLQDLGYELPDIDLDLPSGDQRERAIQYVYERYGKLGAAMTANVITYRGRSAAREVGKVLGFDDEMLGRLSGLVHTWEWKDPKDTTERQFRDAGLDLRDRRIKKFFQLYTAVQDLPRHLGQHSGGMGICQGQLDSAVPLEPATMPGRVVVQWDKEDCADLGIVKVDLLGLGMMAALKDCLELIPQHYGEEVDLAHLPADDPAVYAALQKADTVGMFQIESRAQMSCLPRLRPSRFYDIVIQVAIIRPGPIVGQMVNPFLKRRQGREVVRYAHPALQPVLQRTLGVPLFQEQLLRMAMIVANFSGGEAEELRRAVGSKRSAARMREIEAKLRQGMTANRIPPATQEEIILSITSFALYGFPESHAASFALLAYASAYLKCHYLAAFTAALLNNQPMGFYSPATLVKDAQRHGLKIRPIDILRSEWLCTLEPGDAREPILRMGLRYVRGLREEAAKEIVAVRAGRDFVSVDDLVAREPAVVPER